nr:HAD hydrolase-like protein [Leptospira yanagawae]
MFWDFDGVIKDSVNVKTEAYLSLFPNIAKETLHRIRNHHLNYGGISRFEKIPLYLEWAGLPSSSFDIKKYLDQFEIFVVQRVIASPWIPGVEEFLKRKPLSQKFVIVTGTPENEILEIIKELNIDMLFDRVYGAPTEKEKAINLTLEEFHIDKESSILIGDSKTDWLAAQSTGIDFLYKESELDEFSKQFKGNKIRDFLGLI